MQTIYMVLINDTSFFFLQTGFDALLLRKIINMSHSRSTDGKILNMQKHMYYDKFKTIFDEIGLCSWYSQIHLVANDVRS